MLKCSHVRVHAGRRIRVDAELRKESAVTETTTEFDQRRLEREFAIVINGELAVVPNETVSYTEVVAIAYPVPPAPDTTFTVSYRKAKGPRHDGLLVAGQTVEVKKQGTVFNVAPTGKS
jgi:hypothetical protein